MLACFAAVALLSTTDNTLSPSEKRAGWKLLFDGKTTKGWHNHMKSGVGPGWHIVDGVLTSVDPGTAGDIVTDDLYDFFEISLDFNLTKGGNSGIMVHVADQGDMMWFSGPEIQIYDDHGEEGAQKTGFLYDMYSSKVDSTKAPGQWNHMDILISPKKWETKVNGTLYWSIEPNTADFWDRIAKSKFNEWPYFAKLQKGRIGIQGDHGQVSFKNVKVRPLKIEVK